MDLLLICRDALENSIISNLLVALEEKKAGADVGVLFTQEALQMGLANKVVPLKQLDEEVDQWCDELLDISPTCLSLVKASFDGDIDYMDGDFGRYLMQMAPDFFDGEEMKEAQQAFFDKRTPNFWKNRTPKDVSS